LLALAHASVLRYAPGTFQWEGLMAKERKPMFTKPAGVFLQLLGAVAVIGGTGMLASGGMEGGVVATIVGFGLLWLGRQTHPRKA
jgi:hypothetical protein